MSSETPGPGDLVRLAGTLSVGSPPAVLKGGTLGVIEGIRGEVRDLCKVRFLPTDVYLSIVCEGTGGVVLSIPRHQLRPGGEDRWLSYWMYDHSGKVRQVVRRCDLARVWEWSPKGGGA